MLLPYSVERPVKRQPVCTYTLMAINIVIYLITIIHANVMLPQEKAAWNKGVETALQKSVEKVRREVDEVTNNASPDSSSEAPIYEPTPEMPPDSGGSFNGGLRAPLARQAAPGDTGSVNDNEEDQEQQDDVFDAISREDELEKKAESGKISQDEVIEYQTFAWRKEHRNDIFVLEPHPSILKWLAYWVGAPGLLGFFASMFLHGSLDHIVGNMLFLWLFGRALEDALGPLIYTFAYFVCGIAAALLFHISTMMFSPSSAMMPFLGASGAIAGVQGLFAPRFYRTPVKVFYTTYMGIWALSIISGGLGFVLYHKIGTAGLTLAFLITVAGIVYLGEDTLWRDFQKEAMWVIGGFFVWNDVLKVALELYLGRPVDGVAHWAHIGGFLCGVAYAFMVGLTGEGKTEYLMEDVKSSLEKRYGTNALEDAQKLLKLKPGDPTAYRLIAEAYDAKNDINNALDNWEMSITAFCKKGDREGAASAYLTAVARHETFIMAPDVQFTLGNHMARQGDHIGAALTLVKIPFTFPEAPEGELALLRSAQLYAQYLHDPQMANYLLTTLLQRYPQTQWMSQVQQGLQMTQQQMAGGVAPMPDAASSVVSPVEVPKTKLSPQGAPTTRLK